MLRNLVTKSFLKIIAEQLQEGNLNNKALNKTKLPLALKKTQQKNNKILGIKLLLSFR